MATQYELLTGRRVPSNAAEAIQSRLPLLYQQRQQKADTAYQDKVYAQNERALEQQATADARTIALAERAQQQQREAAEKARKAGVAGLGLQAGLGIAEYGKDFGNLFGLGGDSGEKVASAYPENLAPSTAGGVGNAMDYLRNYGMGSATATGASDGFSLGDMGRKALSSALSKDTLAGATIGATAGPLVGEALPVFGGSGKDIAGSALTGALASALTSGGDLYDTAMGSLLSAGFSGLKSLW